MKADEYLLQIPMWTKKKNTLSDVQNFLKALGDPEQGQKIIHVAGTNGKGSVCADLTAILREAGYHTGTFISPHLVDMRERFLLDGRMVSEEDFQKTFDEVRPVVDALVAKGYCHPTYFEYCFLMAMVLFRDKKMDYWILETGLGGRLDTTNVIRNPLVTVITSISLDHTQYLGDTLAAIAGEKAGILKKGVPVVYDDNCAEASAVIEARASAIGCRSFPVNEAMLNGIPELSGVSFGAPYQRMNAALAVRAAELLHIPEMTKELCQAALKQVFWQGRMEQAAPHIWLDGAHNPGGIRAFVRTLRERGEQGIHLLFAAVADKDYKDMIHMLCDGLDLEQITVAHLDSSRASDQKIVADLFREEGCLQVEQHPDVKHALESAVRKRNGQHNLYVVGSLYLIGEIKQLLTGMDLQEEEND